METPRTTKEEIKAFMNEYDVSGAMVARHLGFHHTGIHKLLTGKTKCLSVDKSEKFNKLRKASAMGTIDPRVKPEDGVKLPVANSSKRVMPVKGRVVVPSKNRDRSVDELSIEVLSRVVGRERIISENINLHDYETTFRREYFSDIFELAGVTLTQDAEDRIVKAVVGVVRYEPGLLMEEYDVNLSYKVLTSIFNELRA
jgi:hypothetical protein